MEMGMETEMEMEMAMAQLRELVAQTNQIRTWKRMAKHARRIHMG